MSSSDKWHIRGPADIEQALTVGSLTASAGVSGVAGTFTGAVSGTTGTFSGAIKSGASVNATTSFNFKPFCSTSTTSTIVLAGLVTADVIAAAFKIRPVIGAVSVVSDLTSLAVPASGSVTFTGTSLNSAFVLGFYVDVSAAS